MDAVFGIRLDRLFSLGVPIDRVYETGFEADFTAIAQFPVYDNLIHV